MYVWMDGYIGSVRKDADKLRRWWEVRVRGEIQSNIEIAEE